MTTVAASRQRQSGRRRHAHSGRHARPTARPHRRAQPPSAAAWAAAAPLVIAVIDRRTLRTATHDARRAAAPPLLSDAMILLRWTCSVSSRSTLTTRLCFQSHSSSLKSPRCFSMCSTFFATGASRLRCSPAGLRPWPCDVCRPPRPRSAASSWFLATTDARFACFRFHSGTPSSSTPKWVLFSSSSSACASAIFFTLWCTGFACCATIDKPGDGDELADSRLELQSCAPASGSGDDGGSVAAGVSKTPDLLANSSGGTNCFVRPSSAGSGSDASSAAEAGSEADGEPPASGRLKRRLSVRLKPRGGCLLGLLGEDEDASSAIEIQTAVFDFARADVTART